MHNWSMSTDDLGRAYPVIIDEVLSRGELVQPRGMATREIRPFMLTLYDPSKCIVARPGFSRSVMWAEIAQVVGGVYSSEMCDLLMPEATRNLFTEHGAYGPRTRTQLMDVVDELTSDPYSRRAVVYIGRPNDLAVAPETHDVPCTLTWQFMLRDGGLEMIVNMRSWDLVWGLSYDIPVFVSIQNVVAAALGVWASVYTHIAGSAHIYERHWDIGEKLQEAPDRTLDDVGVRAFTGARTNLSQSQLSAREAIRRTIGKQTVREGAGEATKWRPAIEAWERKLGRGLLSV